MENIDIIIIGAGPAGSTSAALLSKLGHKVLIVEKSKFPRFVIGESLLPQNMVFYKEAGLEHVLNNGNHQYKDGAQFLCGDEFKDINFENKFTAGPFSTFQVKRHSFDQEITKAVSKMGVDILFEHELTKVELDQEAAPVIAQIHNIKENKNVEIHAKFIVDASGLAKVLPKLLDIPTEYKAQNRASYFNHIKTTKATSFDNNKILITVDETNKENWFWTIPLSENYYSLGVITTEDCSGLDEEYKLNHFVDRNPTFKKTLGKFEYVFPEKKLQGYTAKTETMYGKNFVLIGNSGEFLDPIFSSGITIALKTASLSAPLIHKEITGEICDWEKEYATPLNLGLNTFSNFVKAWYQTDLQDIIFSKKIDPTITGMIISILAGYAWDPKNHYTKNTERRLKALAEICRELA
jgi:flavin-dependent dehydrogenase